MYHYSFALNSALWGQGGPSKCQEKTGVLVECIDKHISERAKMQVRDVGNGKISIQLASSGLYCTDSDSVECRATTVSDAQQFAFLCLSGCEEPTGPGLQKQGVHTEVRPETKAEAEDQVKARIEANNKATAEVHDSHMDSQ